MMTNKNKIGIQRVRQIYTIGIETVCYEDYAAIQEFIENHDFEAHFQRTSKSSMTARVLETNNPCFNVVCTKTVEQCEEDERAEMQRLLRV